MTAYMDAVIVHIMTEASRSLEGHRKTVLPLSLLGAFSQGSLWEIY